MSLNESGLRIAHEMVAHAARLRAQISVLESGATLIDCGVHALGGLEAGCRMAEVCLAGLGQVALATGDVSLWNGPWVTVHTDQPLAACMAAQYAGWPLNYEDFFAMGSGPMRAARGREPLLEQLDLGEDPSRVIGVLEGAQLPTDKVCGDIARQCGVEPAQATLLVARTASLAGTVQVVARSVETALHKLFELGFELGRVVAGFGTAPLPPVAGDDLTGVGRTNDAVLYGGRVTLWVRGDDETLQSLGPRVPSSSSPDYGRPFAAIFEHYERDFYRIDPLLFSPSEVHFVNVDTGRLHRFGQPNRDVLQSSFGGH